MTGPSTDSRPEHATGEVASPKADSGNDDSAPNESGAGLGAGWFRELGKANLGVLALNRPLGLRLLTMAVMVGAWFLANGYLFGVEDHALHLPYLDRVLDPAFLQGDALFSVSGHASLFWQLQAPFVRRMPIEVFYLLLHVASVWMLIGGIAYLARSLFPGKNEEWVAIIAVVLGIIGCKTFAIIPSFDHLMLNRTVVLGAELYSLGLAVRGRFLRGYALAGLAFNVHATTAFHTAALIGAVALANRATRVRGVIAGWAFVVGALPLLVTTVGTGTGGVPWPAPQAWFDIVTTAFPFHHFYGMMSRGQYDLLLVPLIVVVTVLRGRPHKLLWALLAGMFGVLLLHFVITYLFRLPIGVQLHLVEVTRFLNFLACAAIASLLVETPGWPWGRATWSPWLIAGTYLLFSTVSFIDAPEAWLWREVIGVHALVVCVVWLRGGEKRAESTASAPAWLASVVALAVALPVGWLRGDYARFVWRSEDVSKVKRTWCHEHPRSAELPAGEVCGLSVMKWARDELPVDAVVVTPPYFGHPLTSFRHIARRSIVTNFKDGGEATFDYQFAQQWAERIGALTGQDKLIDVERPDPAWWGLRQRTFMWGWRNADTGRFQDLAARYGATHAIVEAQAHEGSVSFPVVYRDEAFVVYAIR